MYVALDRSQFISLGCRVHMFEIFRYQSVASTMLSSINLLVRKEMYGYCNSMQAQLNQTWNIQLQ